MFSVIVASPDHIRVFGCLRRSCGSHLGNKPGARRILVPSAQGKPAPVGTPRGRRTMLNPSRRDFVVSAGLAAALGLNARLVVSPAFAQKTPDPAQGFVKYKVGTAEVTALYDGI